MTQRSACLEEEPTFITRQPLDVLARLLPDRTTLHLDAWEGEETAAQITLRVQSTQTHAPCPQCATLARRIHSHYERTLADLPWAAYRVRLQLRVRKWFCRNRACPRRIFTERLPTVAAPWARRTLRLAQRLVALGGALGGQAGVRLGHAWDVPVSRNTLLRLLRRPPEAEAPTPRVLGVDDWALRKGHTYGTILVDLERHQPIALLPDRTGDTLAHWLQAHPGVEVIARDRASAYAEGARQGAPAATQVADRFHLFQNLRTALDQVFLLHAPALEAVNALGCPPSTPRVEDGPVPIPPPAVPRAAQQRAAQRHAQRQAVHAQIWALHRQGWTVRAIARHVRRSKRTVERDLRCPTFVGRKRRRDCGRSQLDPYKPLLLAHWNAGCHTATRLWRLLRQQGYMGSYNRVGAYTRQLRQAQGLGPGRRSPGQPVPAVAASASPLLTPRSTAWLVLRREERRTEAETQQLGHLRRQQPALAEAIDLAQDFTAMVRQRQPARLEGWLVRAMASTVAAVRRFAQGLRDDEAAVKAGITGPWSTGPVEGCINRLKMLKRQMFGRAHLALLRRRFLRGQGAEPLSAPAQQTAAPAPGDLPASAQ